MGNQVKPVRFLLAGTGYGWLHSVGHVLSPSDPRRNFGRRPGYGILPLHLRLHLSEGIWVHGT